MCGRYRIAGDFDLVRELSAVMGQPVTYAGEPVLELLAGDGVFGPYNDIPVMVREAGGGLLLSRMYWQLIPYWCERFESSYTSFNTRFESLEKEHNLELLARKRCIIPATSFFETRKDADGKPYRPRQSFEFSLRSAGLLLLGGIYSVWRNPLDSAEARLSCSIITMEPNSIVGEIHPRMPFIVPYEDAPAWLDRNMTDIPRLLDLIRPYPDVELIREPPVPR